MADHKHITLPDPNGWQVRIVRNKKEHSRYFSHTLWGTKTKALNAAKKWRDQMLISLGKTHKYLVEKGISSNKKSTGVNGVSRSIQYSKRHDNHHLIYSVHFRVDGHHHTKNFYVGPVGTVDAEKELHAFKTARQFRREYELFKSEEIPLNIERFIGWKEKQVY